MKTDLATSIGAAIAGVLIAFFICNLFVGEIEDFTYQTIDTTNSTSNIADVSDPDPEVFNFKALNPTVEVYVGECDEYDAYGECIEINVEPEENPEDNSTENPDWQESN